MAIIVGHIRLNEETREVLKPGFRVMLEICCRSEIYILHFTLGQRLRYIVIFIYVYVIYIFICFRERDK